MLKISTNFFSVNSNFSEILASNDLLSTP